MCGHPRRKQTKTGRSGNLSLRKAKKVVILLMHILNLSLHILYITSRLKKVLQYDISTDFISLSSRNQRANLCRLIDCCIDPAAYFKSEYE